jgi:hypothetical protein
MFYVCRIVSGTLHAIPFHGKAWVEPLYKTFSDTYLLWKILIFLMNSTMKNYFQFSRKLEFRFGFATLLACRDGVGRRSAGGWTLFGGLRNYEYYVQ